MVATTPSVPAPTSSTSPLPGSHATTAAPPDVCAGAAPADPNSTSHQKPLPALPSPEDVAAANSSSGDSGITVMEVNGAAVALDRLGPMVVAKDGTVSRINNWGEMTAIERENTLRILGKRNQLRLANLRGENKS
ncbi:hypothetical protein OQA88_5005 [Cercophora sp. LCS_1]